MVVVILSRYALANVKGLVIAGHPCDCEAFKRFLKVEWLGQDGVITRPFRLEIVVEQHDVFCVNLPYLPDGLHIVVLFVGLVGTLVDMWQGLRWQSDRFAPVYVVEADFFKPSESVDNDLLPGRNPEILGAEVDLLQDIIVFEAFHDE